MPGAVPYCRVPHPTVPRGHHLLFYSRPSLISGTSPCQSLNGKRPMRLLYVHLRQKRRPVNRFLTASGPLLSEDIKVDQIKTRSLLDIVDVVVY